MSCSCPFPAAGDADLAEIRDYVATDRPGAAVDLVRRLISLHGCCFDLSIRWELQPRLGREMRRLVEAPYLIFYIGRPNEVVVVRVLHGARRITRRLLREG